MRRAAAVENINLAAADEMWSKGTFCVPIGGESDSVFLLAVTLWCRPERPGDSIAPRDFTMLNKHSGSLCFVA